MEIDKDLYQEIKEYCRLNGIKDVKSEVTRCLRHGFNVLKYGDNPFQYHNPMEDEKQVDLDIPKDFVIKSAKLSDDNSKIELSFIGCDGEDNSVSINIETNDLIDINPTNGRDNELEICSGGLQGDESIQCVDEESRHTTEKNRRKRKITINRK